MGEAVSLTMVQGLVREATTSVDVRVQADEAMGLAPEAHRRQIFNKSTFRINQKRLITGLVPRNSTTNKE